MSAPFERVVLSTLALGASLLVRSSGNGSPCPASWSQKTGSSPSPRYSPAMAYDAARRKTLLFGGASDAGGQALYFGDTWTWDGAAWVRAASHGPAPRQVPVAVYDETRERVVLFGGSDTALLTGNHYFPETWEWDGAAWTERAASGPPGRGFHAMAYDAARRRVVLFGGDRDHTPLGDTWEWDGSSWTLASTSGPSPRYEPAMGYDRARRRVVLFGGATGSGLSDELWEWDGTSWTRRDTSAPRPPACYGCRLAWDDVRRALVLFGGSIANATLSDGSLWELSGSTWTRHDEPGPGPRDGAPLAYDAARRRLVVFGGLAASHTYLSDTWERTAPGELVRLVPIVLDVFGVASSHFTTELALANRQAGPTDVALRYTASLGALEGSGDAADGLAAGEQRVLPDVLAYLRGRGVPVPDVSTGPQGGTLRVSFACVDDPADVAAVARTTTATSAPLPVGRAGLAYGAVEAGGAMDALTVFGLRSDAADRSNLAVYDTSGDGVTLRVTASSGGVGAPLGDPVVLGPYGWRQFSFGASGLPAGSVRVERLSGGASFGAYGVINDNVTSDGSFLAPSSSSASASNLLVVPVVVETPSFVSELVLSNGGEAAATFRVQLVESLSGAPRALGSAALEVGPGGQRSIPDFVDFLRSQGIAIGPRGPAYAGALRVLVEGVDVASVSAGARTAARVPGGGQFGLFTPALRREEAATERAALYGLRADETNRSNVAIVNAGTDADGPVTLSVQAYDGDAGGAARGTAAERTLAPGQWAQLDSFLSTQGVRNGWVVATRTAGSAPWLAYGVVNDGGSPGQRTGDGAYVPMTR